MPRCKILYILDIILFPILPRYSRISKNNDSAEMLWSGKGYCAQTSKYHMTNVSIGHRRILKSMFISFAFAFYHLCFSLSISLITSLTLSIFFCHPSSFPVYLFICAIPFPFRILNKNAFSALIFLFKTYHSTTLYRNQKCNSLFIAICFIVTLQS